MESIAFSPRRSLDGQNQLVHQSIGLAIPQLPLATQGRIPVLDGLRGLAILLVLLWHGVFQFESRRRILSTLLMFGRLSWSGVDLFFVLSGFLIGGILLDVKNSAHYFQTFYLRRAYRIVPIYALVLAVYVIGRHLLPVHIPMFADFWEGSIPSLAYATFAQNFWMARAGSFGPVAMIVTWSLAVEEQFYLTVPTVVRTLSRFQLVCVLGLVVLMAPILRSLLFLNFNHGDFAAYVLMPCRADGLSLGVLSALLVRDERVSKILLSKRTILCGVAGMLLAVLVWLSYQRYNELSRPMVTYGYSVLAVFYTCCLLIALTSNGWVRRVLSNRWLTKLGGIAYCTYLLHLPLMEASVRLLGLTAGPKIVVGRLLGCAEALVIAILSWRFFEEPMLRRGHAHKY